MKEMHEDIKKRWNEKITNGDYVYILGDIAMRGKQEELIAFVAQLKGHKILVKGNHDDVSDLRYKQLFEEVCDYKEITDKIGKETVHLVLSHYPILLWKNQHRGSIHLYGHVHNTIEDAFFKECIENMNKSDFKGRKEGDKLFQAYNVGCRMPYMNYEPRTLEEIIGK